MSVDQRGPDFEETQKGFKVVEHFFKKIDRDNGGSVDPQELKAALFEASADGGTSQEILEARFKELDFNGDGNIEFPEFLYCMTKWVMGDDVSSWDCLPSSSFFFLLLPSSSFFLLLPSSSFFLLLPSSFFLLFSVKIQSITI